ncbi:N-acyl homoserine lactonase family protein [Chloroflexota bacterium]
MKHCAIHPIPLWTLPYYKASMTYLANFGQPLCLTGYVWYIEGAGENILVDSGADGEYLSKNGLPAYTLQTIESGLNSVGVTVDDIDLIIQTHLHLDHVACASRFPNSRIIVQKSELEFARNPHSIFEEMYKRELFDGLKLELIDGDLEISEDINIISTPGHTPGSQSVSVRTDEGLAVIAGMCTLLENFYPPTLPNGRTVPVIAPGIHINVIEAYDSVMKIKDMADIIIPIHDPSFINKKIIS